MINFTIAINSEYVKDIEDSIVSRDPIELDSKDPKDYNKREWMVKKLNDVVKDYLAQCNQYKARKDALKNTLNITEDVINVKEDKDG